MAASGSSVATASPDQASFHTLSSGFFPASNNSISEFSGGEDPGFSSGASDYGASVVPTRRPLPLSASAPAAPGPPDDTDDDGPAPASRLAHVPSYDLDQLERDTKVLHSGYLLRLVRRYSQWRRKWVVLRSKNLVLYKSEKEYQPLKVIPLDDIVDVMEIDPLSRSKRHCLQLITPEKRLRFCAASDEDLTAWLVALKAAIARYKRE
ncbi:uncharacterized protein V1510DRAFT_422338 [Dipodascopsis tothii]|uniref:uncharacterized protein n=1 Tax=Dipodascopsis tothii TaxID=44089 RepID=UPI0034CFEB12